MQHRAKEILIALNAPKAIKKGKCSYSSMVELCGNAPSSMFEEQLALYRAEHPRGQFNNELYTADKQGRTPIMLLMEREMIDSVIALASISPHEEMRSTYLSLIDVCVQVDVKNEQLLAAIMPFINDPNNTASLHPFVSYRHSQQSMSLLFDHGATVEACRNAHPNMGDAAISLCYERHRFWMAEKIVEMKSVDDRLSGARDLRPKGPSL